MCDDEVYGPSKFDLKTDKKLSSNLSHIYDGFGIEIFYFPSDDELHVFGRKQDVYHNKLCYTIHAFD